MATVALKQYQHYIGGAWVDAAEGATFESFNPATGEPWYQAARGSAEDMRRAVAAAKAAFQDPAWRGLTATRRGHLLRRLGDLIAENAERLAVAESTDNGKLIREMRGQLATLPEWYWYFAGLADKVHGDVIPALRREILNYTLREPLGVVGAITPWNSPLLLTSMKLAPALAAGNTIVIKPSEHTSASLLEMMRLVEEAGFPPGVVNVVTGFGADAGAALVNHPDVAKVAFTGSSETGRLIASQAGQRLARVTLELGGKSPQVVFDDADPQSAAMGIVAGVFAAAGQTCVAGSRVFVQEGIYDEVLERVLDRTRRIRIGDPLDGETELGPLALREQLEKVRSYVQIGRETDGATLLHGGGQPRRGRVRRLVPRADHLHRRAQRHAGLPGGDLRAGRDVDEVPRRGARPSSSRTRPSSGSPRASGRATWRGRTGWRPRSTPAPSGSTPTGRCRRCRRWAGSSCPAWARRTAPR